MKNEDQKTTESRRAFLSKITIGMGSLAAGLISIPVIASLIAPFLKKTTQVWRNVGQLNDFKIGTTNLLKFENADPVKWAGVTAHSAAWLRKNGEKEFIAFSVNCTHMGCPVRWMPDAELFMCPCHGGVYYKDGSRASGPPPKGLQQLEVRINKGQVQILTGALPITTLKNA